MTHLRNLLVMLVCLLPIEACRLCAQTAAAKDPWAPLQFLVGTWIGEGSGEPGPSGTGGSTFFFELDKQILVRNNWAKYPPRPGEKTGISHEDLMIIYPDSSGAAMRAIYFDNEEHVIEYSVQPAGSDVVFESAGSPSTPSYRLTYTSTGADHAKLKFEIAPPGKSFATYIEASVHREP